MLDQAQIARLTPADREKYMALERFFASAGWKWIRGMAETRAAAMVERAAFANSWADNRLAIGAGTAWNELVKLEETEMYNFERLISEAEKAAAVDTLENEVDWQT